ncbi:MAG: O-antigen ligase family protein [Pseudomonadota bacterium]
MNVSTWFKSETWDLSLDAWILVSAIAVASTLLFVGASASAAAAVLIVATPIVLLCIRRHRLQLEPAGLTTIVASGCWLYACISYAWAADSGFAIRALLISGVAVVAVHVSRSVHSAMPEDWLEHMTRTILVVFVLFAIYGLIEEGFDHPIKRLVFWPFQAFQIVDGWPTWNWEHVSRVRATRTNWNVANLSLLLWPVLLMLRTHVNATDRRWMLPALIALTLTMALFSNHQTSMIALALGIIIFCLAQYSIKAAALVAAAGWCLAITLMVPATQWAFQRQLHLETSLPFSLRHRVVIWGYTADQITKKPVFGVGVASTESLDDARPNAERFREVDGTVFHARTGGHPHNFYLQVLYEFGAIGGACFLALGLAIVWCASRLPNPDASHNLAAFVTAAVMSASTFGLFELWYVSVLAVTAVLLSLAAAFARRIPIKTV